MRKALITAAALGAALTLPAAAFADPGRNGQYRCKSDKDDQVVGALIGGVLGGLLGSEVAGRRDRTEGAVAGAVLGGVAGAAIADGKDCNRGKKYGKRKYRNRYNTGYNTGYNTNRGYNRGYNNGHNNGYNTNTRYGRNDPYANDRRANRRHERRERRREARYENNRRGIWNEQLEGGYRREATYNSGYNAKPYNAQTCRYRNVTTHYNNGASRTRKVKECRNSYGKWTRH